MSIFEDKFNKHTNEVKSCANLPEFIDAIKENDNVKEYMRTNSGSYAEQLFSTFKHHGFQPKALLCAESTSIKEFINDAVLLPSNMGNGKYASEAIAERGERWVYASGLRSEAILFGNIGHDYGVHVYKKDKKFFCFSSSGGENYSTYLTPTEKFMTALDIETHFDAALKWHIEFCQRDNGTTLVIAKREFYSQWLAILDTEQLIKDVRDMLPADKLAEWDATRAKDKEVKSCVDHETGLVDLAKLNELQAPIKER